MTTKVQSSTINTVANTQITGLITASQIDSVSNTQITGTITSSQISSIPGNSPTTFTASQTFNGSSSNGAIKILNGLESANVLSTAPVAEQNIYVSGGSVIFFNSNATTNWNINVAFSPTTTLNSVMSVNDSLTIAVLVKQGTTAYYNTQLKIDGVSQTIFPQGGTQWSSGNSSGIDAYTYTIIKTASSTYTVLAAQTQY